MSRYFTLRELAALTQSKAVGDLDHKIDNINSLDAAAENEVSFLSNPRYKDLLKCTRAGIICVDHHTPLTEGKNFLIGENPSQVFQKITDLIVPPTESGFKGIHPTAVIHSSATIEDGVDIGPHVVIDKGVKIKKGTTLFPHVYLGAYVEIGESCTLHCSVTVRERCILKNRVILQPGVVIGSCGFGYITDQQGCHRKIEQLGNVIIEDDVEIGANTTIDRARFKHTLIKRGTKIDNLVQIGHNVILGQHNIIVAQTGISGSAKTGNYVIMGGQAGVVGHVEIADNTQIATRGGVTKSVSEGGQYGGNPLQPLSEFNKHRVHLKNISKYVEKITKLEKKLAELESKFVSS